MENVGDAMKNPVMKNDDKFLKNTHGKIPAYQISVFYVKASVFLNNKLLRGSSGLFRNLTEYLFFRVSVNRLLCHLLDYVISGVLK